MDPHLKELEQNRHRLELIKLARELLNEEYINRRAQDHNRWLAESDALWRTNRVKLPYPPFASYPTDEEIVAKASALYRFVNSPQAGTNTQAVTTEATLPELTPTELKVASTISPESSVAIEVSPWETYSSSDTADETARSDSVDVNDAANIPDVEIQTPVPATLDTTESKSDTESHTQINHAVSGLESLLPGWVRRSHAA